MMKNIKVQLIANSAGSAVSYVSKALLSGLSVCTLVVMASCGAQNFDNASELKHDVDQPIRSQDAFNWTSVSDAEYKTYVAPLLGLGNNFLASSHEISTRSQFWIDAIDSNLRRKYPSKMVNVPKPLARIIANPSVNAFIAPIPVCIEASVKLGAGSGSQVDTIYFDQGTGGFGSWPAQYKCRNDGAASDGVAMLRAMVTTFNANSTSACKLALTTERGSNVIAANSSCGRDSDINGVGRASKIAFVRTAAYVNIYTGLLSAMDTEESFIGVIAHELGHYYRSHITADDDFYGYFYEMTAHNENGRPVRGNQSLQDLGKKAVMASRVIGGGASNYKAVPSQKFHSRVYLGIGSFAQDSCKEGTCPAACTAFVTFMNSPAHQSATQMFPFRDLSAAGRLTYAEFETKASACLVAVASTSANWDDMVAKVAKPTWPKWIFTGNYKDAVYQLQDAGAQLISATAPTGTRTAADAFSAMSNQIKSAESSAEVNLKLAFDRNLGQYTTEQEADDASAEWLVQLNINPKFAGDTQMNLGKWAASKGADISMPFDIGYAECERVRKNGWLKADGAYQYIAIGDYDEVHHGFCYRAFNVDREAAAHSYRVDPNGVKPTPTGSTWAQLKVLADQATTGPELIGNGDGGGQGGANALPTDPAALSLLRKLQSGSCPMAPKLVK